MSGYLEIIQKGPIPDSSSGNDDETLRNYVERGEGALDLLMLDRDVAVTPSHYNLGEDEAATVTRVGEEPVVDVDLLGHIPDSSSGSDEEIQSERVEPGEGTVDLLAVDHEVAETPLPLNGEDTDPLMSELPIGVPHYNPVVAIHIALGPARR